MKVDAVRTHARSGIEFTAAGFGGAPIGNFNHPFTDTDARETVVNSWNMGIRYFDTAPGYGNGLSEYRLAHALRDYDRSEYVLSSKVGRVVTPRLNAPTSDGQYKDIPPFVAEFDYSYDGVMRSVERSMQRMLCDRFDILFIHDVDRYTHGAAQPELFKQAIEGAYPALESLRDQGVVKAIGFGINDTDVMTDAVRSTDADLYLLAGRYTLLEQEPLDEVLPLCEEQGIGIVLGGVYNSGILATGPTPAARFNYALAPESVKERAGHLERICSDHHVPLAAAALQFAYAHPSVLSICIGARNVEQQKRNAELFDTVIPQQLWADLRAAGLVRDDAPTPES
ncbi:aldo/keto reductase [Rhodococcus sp. NPDC056960]|uniref:aldo/keto reductase n=1 Tax=Rhodococcus sp. NPDC056960 TaxID=3345982 RepID=UPI003641AE05